MNCVTFACKISQFKQFSLDYKFSRDHLHSIDYAELQPVARKIWEFKDGLGNIRELNKSPI